MLDRLIRLAGRDVFDEEALRGRRPPLRVAHQLDGGEEAHGEEDLLVDIGVPLVHLRGHVQVGPEAARVPRHAGGAALGRCGSLRQRLLLWGRRRRRGRLRRLRRSMLEHRDLDGGRLARGPAARRGDGPDEGAAREARHEHVAVLGRVRHHAVDEAEVVALPGAVDVEVRDGRQFGLGQARARPADGHGQHDLLLQGDLGAVDRGRDVEVLGERRLRQQSQGQK